MSNVVKYHNDLNRISFSNFTEKEINLFFSLLFLAREQGKEKIFLNFSELRDLSNGDIHSKRFIKSLTNVNEKMIKLHQKITIEKKTFIFTLFNLFLIDEEEKKLIVQINENFYYMLNEIIGNYTKFDLLDFVKLNSIYSKSMFRLLKQWENIGIKEFDLNELKSLLGTPQSYDTTNFNKFVLKPIMKELPAYFLNLKLEKNKTGKKVTSLKFTWNKRKDIIEIVDENPNRIEISQNLYDLIKEIQSFNFFKNVMTSRNVEKLTKKYDEKTLIQILKKAENSTFQPIKSIKYFDYVYESIKNEPVIIIKPAEKIAEKEVPNYQPVEKIEKIDITLEEFNKKYKEYLKKWKSPDDPFVKRAFEIKYNIVETEEESIQNTKVFTEKDIAENELLGKNGKKLTGAALQMRIKKLSN